MAVESYQSTVSVHSYSLAVVLFFLFPEIGTIWCALSTVLGCNCSSKAGFSSPWMRLHCIAKIQVPVYLKKNEKKRFRHSTIWFSVSLRYCSNLMIVYASKANYIYLIFFSSCFLESRKNVFSKWILTEIVNFILEGKGRLVKPSNQGCIIFLAREYLQFSQNLE